MREKYIKFIKNRALTAVASVAGGVLGADLSDLLTDSEAIISTSSTISQYVLGFGLFLPLHAYDNQDLYWEEMTNRFKWRDYIKDITKMILGLGALNCLYMVGRSAVNYIFQRQGYDPVTASLLSDVLFIPAYYIASIPMARRIGIIREKETSDIESN